MEFLKDILLRVDRKYPYSLIGGLIVIFGIIGFSIAHDYGLSWDEPLSHVNGHVSLEYVRDGNPALWTYSERYYGTIFEMPFALAQDVFAFTSAQEIFFLRHTATFLVFLAGVFVLYLLCLQRFRSRYLALLGAIFLLLSPRIFADGFYNSKDIPVLVLFIVSIFTLHRLLEKPSYVNVLWHALPSALVIAIRLPGIFIPALTVAFFAANLIFLPEERTQWRKTIALLIVYGVALTGLTILFWPFLWQQPITHFSEALADMSRFSRQMDMRMLYLGQETVASSLPWHYIPVWIAVTTPILYLTLFVLGMTAAGVKFSRNLFRKYRLCRLDFLVLGWFFGPLLSVIFLHSVLYDGWRHLYFIYPALIYFSLVGLEAILDFIKRSDEEIRPVFRGITGAVVGVSLVLISAFMIRNHPYQNLYFNFLAGDMENARKNFDMDYWGLSFREGLEYIAANDSDVRIPLYLAGGSSDTVLILPSGIMDRFEMLSSAERGEAKYVLSNYRWQKYDRLPFDREFYSVRVDGTKVMSVFRMY